MTSKLVTTTIIVLTTMYFLSACRKTEVEKINFIETPVAYYLPKISGTHNWSGTYWYYLNKSAVDTNFRFAIKTISDSIIVAYVANRAETLYYYETNEIAKTIFFNGGYDNSNSNYFSFYLTYYYEDDHFLYEEYYDHHLYASNYTSISEMTLHSP